MPERKPAFARPSETTTSATAPAAKRNTITDSSTASDRCMCPSSESSRLRSNQFTKKYNYRMIKKYLKRKNPNLIQYSIYCMLILLTTV